ncbi:inositol monophosphatase family protein [soil metagenome]
MTSAAPGSSADELLEIALECARRAGAVLLDRASGPLSGVEAKSTATDLVSDADRAAEEAALGLIRDHRPDDGILSEESEGQTSRSGLTWIVDPLDGTINFLFGIPAWAVSVAIEDQEGGLVGVVHDPQRAETFSAVRGRGARLNGSSISVSERPELASALIATGFGYDERVRTIQAGRLPHVLGRVRDIRRGGSAALDLSYVAAGRLDGYFEAPMERWDRAAGQLIVTEAGGVVTDLPAPLHRGTGVVAANPVLHPLLTELIRG